MQKRHTYKRMGFRFIHRKWLTLQENWHKAHQISKNFGLTWNSQFSVTWDSQMFCFCFCPHRGPPSKKKISIRNRKLIQIYLKLETPNFNFSACLEAKDKGTRFVDVWSDQKKTPQSKVSEMLQFLRYYSKSTNWSKCYHSSCYSSKHNCQTA